MRNEKPLARSRTSLAILIEGAFRTFYVHENDIMDLFCRKMTEVSERHDIGSFERKTECLTLFLF